MKLALTALFVMLALPVAGRAQESPATATVPDADVNKALADLHRINLMEIEMGNLAKEKGQSEAVRNYGDTLVRDHEAAESRVEEIAGQINYALAEKGQLLAGAHKSQMERLRNLQGADFDQAFASLMAESHSDAISTLQRSQGKVTGPVADLLNQVIPQLQDHQRTAQTLARG